MVIGIKWRNRYVEKPKELSSLIFFCKQNNFKVSLGINSLEIKSDWQHPK